ncbi:hypothetical protein HYDPIDRAFT_31183 [Hydnomerulius pinastri MD-312]|uniref:Uncharacterized protein n=1 Tax=Hydnomerulius pinastri MD-312 TaxID=994086 RepID=A0A0C9WCE4_9AGAM|nr:hypothetical protein HYDPIDRAFT_31183 [Hydnomerulius pinastri MD-312]
MATTSQGYSSNLLTPTSTLQSSPSSTPTDDGSDPNGMDIFTSNGSPPLIVAFLAIGLFTVAMVAVFGWRRMSQSRGLVIRPVGPDRNSKKFLVLGEKPLLRDVWTRTASGTEADETRWENLMPFAAVLTYPPVAPAVSAPPMKHTAFSNHSPSRAMKELLSFARRFYSPVRPPPPPPPADEEMVTQSSDEEMWRQGSSMQISVTIAMPAPRAAHSETSERDLGIGGDKAELGEFCIGTMEVPWSEGG